MGLSLAGSPTAPLKVRASSFYGTAGFDASLRQARTGFAALAFACAMNVSCSRKRPVSESSIGIEMRLPGLNESAFLPNAFRGPLATLLRIFRQ
jgi:hypothetical protein